MLSVFRLTLALQQMKRLRSASPASPASTRSSPPQKHAKTSSGPFVLSILSWNVDNPSPYMNGAGRSSSSSRPITSYLKRTNGGSKSSKDSKATLNPSLYDIFAAHSFPLVCCLQEVKCLAKDKDRINALRVSAMPLQHESYSSSEDDERQEASAASQNHPSYAAHFSLCKSTFGAGRFGVGTYVSSRFPYQYSTREVEWDAEGRVLIMTVPRLKIAIVNIYALNGSELLWRNPLTGQTKGTRNQRKRDFNRLLRAELQKLQEQGLQLILIGDWNISREKRDCFPRLRIEEPHAQARREFNDDFIPSLGVVDVFRKMHGDQRSYSWFAKQKPDRTDAARVDYALLSESLSLQVKRIDYLEEPKWRYQSDHAPIRLDVEFEAPTP